MPSVTYGEQLITYTVQEEPQLKSHYITVDKNSGVILKGQPVTSELAEKLILKKARWILNKLQLVKASEQGNLVSGSRLPYLGKHYYAEVLFSEEITVCEIYFNHSQFKILVNPEVETQKNIQETLTAFYQTKAVEKITPRVKSLSKKLNLPYTALKFRKMEKRWGSCTNNNTIIINYEAIKLPFTLIDYLIVHELCHTVVKNHTKEFWAELAKHLPNWKQLDEKMEGMNM